MNHAADRTRAFIAPPILILAAHVATSAVLGGSPEGALASNLLQMGASLTAALLSIGASRRTAGYSRRFWALIATAFAVWSAAQASYTYQESYMGEAVPQPSWTHFLFRVYGAPLVMALLIAPEEDEGRSPDWQQVFDFAQVGILFLFFYFDLYFVPGADWQGLTGLSVWGFFDLSDVENWSLFAAFLIRARWSSGALERELAGRLVPYLLVYAVSSTAFNYEYATRVVLTGEWPDLVFTLSLTVGSLAAAWWKPGTATRSFSGDSIGAVRWAPAALPLVTLALALPIGQREPRAAFVAVFGSAACFGARLIITLNRRQKLLEALRASEARYSNLLRLAPDAILVHVGGRITFANPATARLLGVASAEAVVGRDIMDFIVPELRAGLADQMAKAGSGPVSRRLVANRADGTRVSFDAVGMPFAQAPGPPGLPARLVIARDVTERERTEAEREALIRELEAKNSELERFTYTVSHDLRSPLITVNAYLAQVEDAAARGDLESVHGDLDRVRRAARKMDRLLRDLLDLSRVGHVLSAPARIPFETLVRDALDLVGGRLRERGVKVEVEPGLPVVYGDRARLLEVVQNLLDNAAKFMGDEPAPLVRIGARDDGGQTVLFIEDNGVGIDPAHHERIFGLFDKLDPKAEGTGVGLALVKRIVELHGGRVWVESRGAGGTTFCLTLPRAPESASAAE